MFLIVLIIAVFFLFGYIGNHQRNPRRRGMTRQNLNYIENHSNHFPADYVGSDIADGETAAPEIIYAWSEFPEKPRRGRLTADSYASDPFDDDIINNPAFDSISGNIFHHDTH